MRRRSAIVLLSVLLIQSIAVPAIAGLTDIPVTGTVKDRAGTGLAAVKVNYGTRQAWTDSSGNFTINLPAGQSFTLYAAKTGLESESQSGTAWPGTEVHFEMYYKLNHWQSPSVFNNSSPVTITVTAKSYAPPTSCIMWNDNASGSQVDLQLANAVPGGESTWTGTHVVPASQNDGTFGTWAVSRECSNGTDLTQTTGNSYVVDKVAPAIDPLSLSPPDYGNTVFTSQPLLAKIRDIGESGVKPSTIAFTLFDEKSGAGVPLSPSSYNFSTGWAKVPPVSLEPENSYQVTLTASDYAGNSAVRTWRFGHIAFDVSSARAWIEGTKGIDQGNNKWAFLPELSISSFAVTAGASQHSGWGSVGQMVELKNVVIEYEILGIPALPKTNIYSEDKTVTVYKYFAKAKTESMLSSRISSQRVLLEPITVELPSGAANAILRMSVQTTVPYVPAAHCSDPSVGLESCTPDPLRFFAPEEFAQQVLEVQSNHGGPHGLGETPMFLTELVQTGVVTQPYWQPVTLDEQFVYSSFEEDILPFLEGVNYEGTIWPPVPSQFSTACDLGIPCIAAQAASQETNDVRRRCIEPDGRDVQALPDEDCRQFNAIPELKTAEQDTSDNTKYTFSYAILSQVGYADNPNTYALEEIGVAWNDEGAWQYLGDDASIIRYDVYYCDGDETDWPRNQYPHHHFVDHQGSAGVVDIFVNPYGATPNGVRQWQYSNDLGIAAANATCTFYRRLHAYQVTDYAIARGRLFYFDTRWRTHRTQFEGTAIGSYAHVWKTYQYDWSLTVGAHAGSSGAGVGFGFNLRPYEKTNARLVAYPRGYEHGY